MSARTSLISSFVAKVCRLLSIKASRSFFVAKTAVSLFISFSSSMLLVYQANSDSQILCGFVLPHLDPLHFKMERVDAKQTGEVYFFPSSPLSPFLSPSFKSV